MNVWAPDGCQAQMAAAALLGNHLLTMKIALRFSAPSLLV